jgi:NAD(P)-dependent dehydrogenase (short-subunit alcohol dehydrogenase family)
MNKQSVSPVWLVTGCSSGLGQALAKRILASGHRLVATARNPGTLDSLADEFPHTCRTAALDVTNPEQVKAAVALATDAFGRLDVVTNNAGIGLVGAFEETGEEQVTRNFATNFFGPLEVIRVALPILRAQRSGCIVNISAAAAIANYPGFSIYGAAKCALEGVSESLALELKPLGIQVIIVQPGPFRTDFIGRSLERAEDSIQDYAPTSGKFLRMLEGMEGKQPGDPAKAAEAIVSAVASESPPLRLVLGKYAQDKVRRKLAGTASELDVWQTVGLQTSFSNTP